MKKMMMFFLVFTCAALFAQNDLSKVKDEIKKANDKMEKAMVQNDEKTLLSLYTEDGISLPNNRPIVKGMDALKKDMEGMKNEKTNKVKFNTNEVFGDGKYYYEIGTFEVNYVNPKTKQNEDDKGKYLTIWEVQKDGSVKAKVDMWNRDKMKESTMAPDMEKKDTKEKK
ncbi:MAG TPA: hypothetical protein VFF33_09325 [Ignavibacteriaceae bacterium]|nr:hypothetical protein [Ignavibacteriaceae bacterium]